MLHRVQKLVARKIALEELSRNPHDSEKEILNSSVKSHHKNGVRELKHVKSLDSDYAEVHAEEGGGLAGLARFGQMLSPFILDVGKIVPTDKPLHYAVRSRNQPLLEKLLESSTWRWDMETQADSVRGERPIHVAAEINNLPALITLLEYGADPHSRQVDFHGLQAVHVAAAKGSVEVLKYLVEKGESRFLTSVDYEGATALHWAVIGNSSACVDILLRRGALVDCIQTKGPQATPVHFGCIQSSVEITEMFAKMQPDGFHRALSIADAEGCIPLHRAIVLDRPKLVEFLLNHGSPTDSLDNERRSPMMLAIIREAWRSATVLLQWGISPFVRDPVFQRTTFHHAAMVGADPSESPELMELFKQHPENQKFLDSIDAFGYSPLQYAAGYGNVGSFRGLLTIGASIEIQNIKNKTVLHYAAKYGQLEMVRSILSYPSGSSILNSMDHRGRSPLHLASSHGHHEVVELLLSKGAFAFRDDAGRTALHLAAAKNHHCFVQKPNNAFQILATFIDSAVLALCDQAVLNMYDILGSIITYFAVVLNNADKDGKTALHLAAASDAGDAVEYLLAIGALITVDAFGRTPLDMTIYYKNTKAALAFVDSLNWKDSIRLPSRLYGTVILGFISHLPEVMKRCLDRCITKSESSRPADCYVEYDFSILEPFEDVKQNKKSNRNGPMNALKTMAIKERCDLLAHPVCTTLLQRKWINYGMWCSGFIMLSNLIFVALLSYVIVAAVTWDLRPHLLRSSYCNVHQHAPDQLNSSAFDLMKQMADPLLFNHSTPHQFCSEDYVRDPNMSFQDTPSLMVLGLALVIMFFKELAELRSEGLKYFLEWMNYMEMALFISCGAFVFCFYQDDMMGKIGPYTYQFGAVAVFLAWFNLLRFCRPFGTFGIYSFMFFCILKTLVKVSFFFFLLTCAFSGSFFTLLHTFKFPNNTEFYVNRGTLDVLSLRTAHYETYTSGLRVGAMTIGDLEALQNFIYPLMDGMLEYPLLSFLFYAIFMILMPILLNNLLIGLAIGDMAAIVANAVSLRLETQVLLHEGLERLFPAKLLHRLQENTQKHRVYPGRRSDLKTSIAQWVQSGGTLQPRTTSEIKNVVDLKLDKSGEASKMENRIKQLDSSLGEQRIILEQMLEKLEKLTHDENDPANILATSISEKVKKRSERTEEDRRHAARIHMAKKNLDQSQYSLRPLLSTLSESINKD